MYVYWIRFHARRVLENVIFRFFVLNCSQYQFILSAIQATTIFAANRIVITMRANTIHTYKMFECVRALRLTARALERDNRMWCGCSRSAVNRMRKQARTMAKATNRTQYNIKSLQKHINLRLSIAIHDECMHVFD